MSSKACMTLVLGCLVSIASPAQVTGGVVTEASPENGQSQPDGQLRTGGVLRKAPIDGQQQQPPPVVPQAQTGLQYQQQNPQVQQIPQQQPFNAPAERRGRNQKDNKGIFGGLF